VDSDLPPISIKLAHRIPRNAARPSTSPPRTAANRRFWRRPRTGKNGTPPTPNAAHGGPPPRAGLRASAFRGADAAAPVAAQRALIGGVRVMEMPSMPAAVSRAPDPLVAGCGRCWAKRPHALRQARPALPHTLRDRARPGGIPSLSVIVALGPCGSNSRQASPAANARGEQPDHGSE
jgi:hypothetical protein